MKVSACLVTRGDVDMRPIIESLPWEWEIVVWDNSRGIDVYAPLQNRSVVTMTPLPHGNMAVFGRYAAIDHATGDVIYVQDDDVIVSDPEAIVNAWLKGANFKVDAPEAETQFDGLTWPAGRDVVVCNMPERFREHYPDSGLVGFGAAFHRALPDRTFERYARACSGGFDLAVFRRRCDNVLATLAPRVFVDIPKTDREMASAPERMWKQPGHVGERDRVIERCRRIRDAK